MTSKLNLLFSVSAVILIPLRVPVVIAVDKAVKSMPEALSVIVCADSSVTIEIFSPCTSILDNSVKLIPVSGIVAEIIIVLLSVLGVIVILSPCTSIPESAVKSIPSAFTACPLNNKLPFVLTENLSITSLLSCVCN